MKVRKKKMQFLQLPLVHDSSNPWLVSTYMMPKAKHAFTMAHHLFVSRRYVLTEMSISPRFDVCVPDWVQLEQSALAMKRSSYTAPMNAPTKSRSTKETKPAECLARLYRNSVPKAHASASTDTMNMTRYSVGVRWFVLSK